MTTKKIEWKGNGGELIGREKKLREWWFGKRFRDDVMQGV